ncbi:MAG: hypothetical protein LBP81_01615 [Treponema sp.]|nr:hypothetical protein [Treponema sp.]
MVEQIGDHYRNNVANRFIRPILFQLPLGEEQWELIEMLTEKTDQFRYQGFLLNELYREIAAAAWFVALTRKEIIPSLKRRIEKDRVSDCDKVLQDMTVNAFSNNLRVFADLVYQLYDCLVEIDEENAKGLQPLYAQLPELQDIDAFLTAK